MIERDPLLPRRRGQTRWSDPRNVGNSFFLPVLLAALVAKSAFVTLNAVPPLRPAAQIQHPHSILLARNQRRVALLSTSRKSAVTRGTARLVSLGAAPPEPDEDELRKQLGRGWVYRTDAHMGSSAGGPGMPLATSHSTNPEDLKHEQFGRVMNQKGFRDFVVDARTGQPVDLSDEQKKKLHAEQMAQEAKEQADIDEILDPWSDTRVPSRFIYPDGESVIPKEFSIKVHGMKDNHVSANGEVSKHTGPVFGIFREGAFGNSTSHNTFGTYTETMGFPDRPLKVRDVDYEDLRDKKEEAIKNATEAREARRLAILHGNHTYYCSGKDCDDFWGHLGAGDQVIDLRTGDVVDGYESVGPAGEQQHGYEEWDLDQHIDPHTGEEMPDCVGPQCKPFTISFDADGKNLIEDEYGPAPGGHAVFGRAIPGDPGASPEQVRNYWRERDWNPNVEGGVEEARPGSAPGEHGNEADDYDDGTNPYGRDPSQRWRYGSKFDHGYQPQDEWGGGWDKDWDWGSWLGFILIGPILTAGVSTFVFMTRGPAMGLGVFGGMVVLDIVMYYFG